MKVSIITPSYNQGKYLKHNLDSVKSQKGIDVEHIVIDGGSSDDSKSILESNSEQLTYWVSEKDNGQTHAINKGIEKSTGDILTWINSDDALTSEALENVIDKFIANPSIDVIHGKTILIDQKGTKTITEGRSDGLPYRYLAGMSIPQPSSFFKRSLLDKVGLPDESLHYGMDYDLFVRFYLNGSFLKTEEVYSEYLLHDESKTVNDSLKFAEEWAKIFSKLLRSIDGTDEIINDFKSLRLYHTSESTYSHDSDIDVSFLKESFKYHLEYQMYYRYEGFDLKNVRVIAEYVKQNYPEHYKSKKLNQMAARAKWPKGVLKLLKRLKGN